MDDGIIIGWAETLNPSPPHGATVIEYDGAFPEFTNTVWKLVDGVAVDTGELPYQPDYSMQRYAEYPSWEDQLDMIYHHGLDAWKGCINEIKSKYPKPS